MKKITTLLILIFTLTTLATAQTRLGQTPDQVKQEVNLPLIEQTNEYLVFEMNGDPFTRTTYYLLDDLVFMIVIDSNKLNPRQLNSVVTTLSKVFNLQPKIEKGVVVFEGDDFSLYITLTQTIIIQNEMLDAI